MLTRNNRYSHLRHPLESYVGRGPIGLFKDLVDSWLDSHPEATTSVQDGSITSVKLADHTITAPKIADEAVSTPHIQDGAITEDKLSPSITMVAISNDEIDLITTL